MSTPETVHGLFAPVLTPINADLSPDAARFVSHAKQILADGCHGLCPFGTTSEASSFSNEERMDLLDQLVDSGISPSVMMPGTGCSAIPDTVQLTKHAVELGCAGVLVLPPYYYKGVLEEGIFRSFAEVIERVGDERLRIYLYHIPPVAQVGFSIKLIERLRNAYPKTVVGIKDSSGDWSNLSAILKEFPGFGTFTGSEKFLLETLRHGGAGSINAVANVIAKPLRALVDGYQNEDAEPLQSRVNLITQTRGGYAPVPLLKQIVAYQRNDPVWTTVRPPLVEMADELAKELIGQIGAAGLPLHS